MARIRTVKPEFFRHRRLYIAEKETRLPLRVAFAGLWTCADREGRFAWEPEELKLDCLPYDEMDFSRVLDALTTRGFIVKYESSGRVFGVIPGFKRHQVINNRERGSEIPEPPNVVIDIRTREPRVEDAFGTRHDLAQVEGKGREGKGVEARATRLPPGWAPTASLTDWATKERPDLDIANVSAKFRDYWQAKPGRAGTKLDWDATFRNWVRDEKQGRQSPKIQVDM